VHGRTSYNLLGGSIELDYDACGGVEGVNNNIYTISPSGGMVSGYCDIQSNDSPICMELDIDENNGNEIGQTTWHIWGNTSGGCDQNGCLGQYWLNPCKYHMRTEFAEDGDIKQFVNGVEIKIDRYGPLGDHASLGDAEKAEIVNQMNSNGAAIMSTQWSGWVPVSAASRGHKSHKPPSAAAMNSTFAITNVVVNAPLGIKFGPAPQICPEWLEPEFPVFNASMFQVDVYVPGTKFVKGDEFELDGKVGRMGGHVVARHVTGTSPDHEIVFGNATAVGDATYWPINITIDGNVTKGQCWFNHSISKQQQYQFHYAAWASLESIPSPPCFNIFNEDVCTNFPTGDSSCNWCVSKDPMYVGVCFPKSNQPDVTAWDCAPTAEAIVV